MIAKYRTGRAIFETYKFAITVCRNPYRESRNFNKYLIINEVKNRGWWLPGGAVESYEDFRQSAIRECKEEAGIDVNLKGVL